MALCAVVYFIVQPTPLSSTRDDVVFFIDHAAIPKELVNHRPLTGCEIAEQPSGGVGQRANGCDVPVSPGKPVWFAAIASLFMHGSITHLLGNLVFFWVFGNNVEDRLKPVGFLLFYLVGGVVATLGHVWVDPNSVIPVVGASGSIAAVMGAYVVWWPRARVQTLIFFFLSLRLPAALVLLAWFTLQFFTGGESGVAWVAHVAGFIFGALVATVLRGRSTARPARTT